MLNETYKNLGIKTCVFIKMRSHEERNILIKSFAESEQLFYEKNNYLRKSKVGLENVYNCIFERYFDNFTKNISTINDSVQHIWESSAETLKILGKELPEDGNVRREVIKSKIKVLFKYIHQMIDFNIVQLKTNIERLHNIENQDNYKKSYELNKSLTNILNESIIPDREKLCRSLQKRLDKKMVSKLELEEIIFESAEKYIDTNINNLKNIFVMNLEINLAEISKKVWKIFSNLVHSFHEDLENFFKNTFQSQTEATIAILEKMDETEKGVFYHTNPIFHESLLKQYSLLIKNQFTYDNTYSDFMIESIKTVIIDKLKSTIETYIKIFICHFYLKLKATYSETTIERLLIENLKPEQIIEKQNITEERIQISKELSHISKIHNIILFIMHNHKNTSDTVSKSGLQMSNIEIFSPRLNMISPHDKKEMTLFKSHILSINKNLDHPTDNRDSRIQQSYIEEDGRYEFIEDEEEDQTFNMSPIRQGEGYPENTSKLPVCYLDIEVKRMQSDYANKLELAKIDDQIIDKLPEKQEEPEMTKKASNYSFYRQEKNNEVLMIWDTTNRISIFDIRSKTIKQQSVYGVPYNMFLENCRYANSKNNVYILGGLKRLEDKTQPVTHLGLFLELQRPSNTLALLPNIPEPAFRNSVIYVEESNSIVSVGGVDQKYSYIYNIDNKKWQKNGQLNIVREDPSLFLLNDALLFCFGGISQKSYQSSQNLIEYKNHKEDNWKFVEISFPDQVLCQTNLLQLSGAGVIYSDPDKILIVGGYNNKDFSDEENVYELLLNQKNLNFSISVSEEKINLAWFPENNFWLSDSQMVNFNVDGEIIVFEQVKKFSIIESGIIATDS